jgi:hypothetical protein
MHSHACVWGGKKWQQRVGYGKAGLQVEGRWVGHVWSSMLQKSKQVGEYDDVFTKRNSD